MNSKTLQAFFSAAMGTVVEYYDYALISLFMPIMAPLFFPADTIYQSLVKGYYIILLAMIARPLGGLFFGYIGDVAGRRTALLSSMYGIALATFAVGVIPTYASIGVWAIITIGVTKAIQVFCFGGEFNGAGIYVVEHVPPKHENLAGSLLTATTLSGSLVASLIGILLTTDFMPDWSWRIAFIFGGVIGFFGIVYRKRLIESPRFKPAAENTLPLLVMIKKFPRELLAAMFMGGFAVISFTTTITFITPVFMAEGSITTHELMFLESGLTLLGMLALIPIGFIADKFSAQKMLVFGCWALTIFAYPLLYLIDSHKVFNLVFASSCLIIINEMVVGPTHAFLKNLFPMGYRYRGSSFGFCLGMSLFGGLTPVVESYLYSYTNHFTALSLWLAFIGLGTLFSINYAVSRKAIVLADTVGLVE
jgi:MHS family proline/betaine transporter-like MFS transporter